MADGASPAKQRKLATTGLPECPYGAGCYRKNPQHFKEFSHSCGTGISGGSIRGGSSSILGVGGSSSILGVGGSSSSAGVGGGSSILGVGGSSSSAGVGGGSSSAGVVAAWIITAAKPVTFGSTSAQLPACWYGVNCYRKNLLHFAEFSHPMSHTSLAVSHGGGSTGVYDSDKGKKTTGKVSKKADILSENLSLVKRFSLLTDKERTDLIKRAFEEKIRLEQELEKAKKIVQDKCREVEHLQKQMSSGLQMLEGEAEALKKTKTTYFPLLPERTYKEGSASQIHFRLAESQFYRLMTGDCAKKTRVTKVEYVVTPHLVKRFREYQKKLNSRSEDLSYPILGFHGTSQANIKPICEQGFRTPGDADFKQKTDAGYYGAGVYFSEFPSYAMGYIQGGSKLMLCQVLPGKVYECKKLIIGEALKDGYDSHMSPCKKELVIFNSAAILPCYVIYFTKAKSDFKYNTPVSKATKQVSNYVPTTDGFNIFEGMTFALTGKLSYTQSNLFALIEKHGGSKGTKASFDILVVPDDSTDHTSEKVQQAIKKSVPIVYESYIFDSIQWKVKQPVIDYGIDG